MASDETRPWIHPVFTRWQRWSQGSRQTVNDFWIDQLARDPQLKGVVWCVDLVFGRDTVVRLGTTTIETTSGLDGQRYIWRGLLGAEPELDHAIGLGDGQGISRSLTFTVANAALAEFMDPVAIVARGRMIAGFGEVSLQVAGMDYDLRLVVMRGDMDDGVTFTPGPGGVLTFSLTDPKETADLNLTQWVIDDERIEGSTYSVGGPEDSSIGERYPIIFNRYIVPALNIETFSSFNNYLIAYGHDHIVNLVYVNGESLGYTGSAVFPYDEWNHAEANAYDNFGVPFRVMRMTGNHDFDGSETVHVDITAAFPESKDLLGLAEWLLESFTSLGRHGLNFDLFARAQNRLGPSEVRACINGSGEDSAIQTIDFIETELMSSFPMVSMAWEGGGYGPVVTDHRTFKKGRLTVGAFPLIERVSDIQETAKTALYNNFTFRYNYNIVDDEYVSVITRTPTNSVLCAISRDNVGERQMDPIESVHVFDDAVAHYIVEWMVAHYAFPSYYVEYQATPWAFFNMFRGDCWEITDAEVGWENAPCTVERVSFKRSVVIVGVRIWDTFYKLGPGAVNQTVVG